MNDSTGYTGPTTSGGLPRGEHWHTNTNFEFVRKELEKDQSDWADHVNTCRVCTADITRQLDFVFATIGGRRRD
jgi:hypothetical protein